MLLSLFPAGCSGSCSDQLPDVIARMGFKSAQTLPRVLTYEPLTKALSAYPVNETSLLRGQQVRLVGACCMYCGLTLPRVLTYQPLTKTLRAYPVKRDSPAHMAKTHCTTDSINDTASL